MEGLLNLQLEIALLQKTLQVQNTLESLNRTNLDLTNLQFADQWSKMVSPVYPREVLSNVLTPSEFPSQFTFGGFPQCGGKRKRLEVAPLDQLKQQKFKKSLREKQRRTVINREFTKLNATLQQLKGSVLMNISPRNRVSILEDFLEVYKSLEKDVVVPELSIKDLTPPTNKAARFKDQSTLSEDEIEKRGKKSQKKK